MERLMKGAQMKNKRHMRIMELISQEDIYTQEELADRLKEMGEDVTQATVSRDIKEMKLVKVADGAGHSRYAAVGDQGGGLSARLIRVFADTVLNIDFSANIILIRTLSGSANAAAEAVDALRWPEILGTIAGDNTFMVVVRQEHPASDVAGRLRALIK
jgi:transcriptional regulator of arginine metabolism